jgi:hypothetical protein
MKRKQQDKGHVYYCRRCVMHVNVSDPDGVAKKNELPLCPTCGGTLAHGALTRGGHPDRSFKWCKKNKGLGIEPLPMPA